MSTFLDTLKELTGSVMFQYLPQGEKTKLQYAIFFNILALAQIKSCQCLNQQSTMPKIIQVACNLIRNCN